MEEKLCIYIVIDEQCGNCDNPGVVGILYEDGELVNQEMCGVCNFGEYDCVDPDEWGHGYLPDEELSQSVLKELFETLTQNDEAAQ